jgi:hypothetical protein
VRSTGRCILSDTPTGEHSSRVSAAHPPLSIIISHAINARAPNVM